MNFSKGIALIQVLLISAIIMVLTLYVTQTARQQVEWAIKEQEYISAQTEIHSVESELIYYLLTSNRQKTIRGDITGAWNFYNNPFVVHEKVSVRIDDLASKVNVQFGPTPELEALLRAQNLSVAQQQTILQSLADWTDSDTLERLNGAEDRFYAARGIESRDGALQTITEFKLINGMSEELYKVLEPSLTLTGANYFNPMNANEMVLSSLLGSDIARRVLQKRNEGTLSSQDFIAITGLSETESQIFYPSRNLKITISYAGESVSLSKTILVELAMLNTTPMAIKRVIWNS